MPGGLFTELVGLLRGSSLRNWLLTDGAEIFSAFDTGSEALQFFREGGGSIRTQDFYAIRRQVLNRTESSTPLEGYPSNQLIPLNWHVTDHGLNLSSDFLYNIKLIGYDNETGLLKEQWMSVASDRQLSSDEVKEVARSYVGEGGKSGEISDYFFGNIEPLARNWTNVQ